MDGWMHLDVLEGSSPRLRVVSCCLEVVHLNELRRHGFESSLGTFCFYFIFFVQRQ